MSLNIEISKDGYKILKIDKDDKKIYLGSKYNQQREIDKFINSFNETTSKDNYIILGLAFGEHIKELLKVVNQDSKILIVEFNNELVEYCKNDDTINKIFENQNISIATDKIDIENFIIRNITEINVSALRAVGYCNYAKIYKEECEEVFIFIRNLANRIALNRNTYGYLGQLFLENMLSNFKYIAKATTVNNLENVYKNKPAIIISAGPSLIKNIDELKGIDKALILSGGRTLGALQERNIEPTCLGIVDPAEDSFKLVEPFIEKVKCPLFFCDLANEKVVKEHKAEKIFYSNCTLLFDAFKEDIKNLYGGGSIAHSLTNFAIHMGCNPIIFIGQDLAYTGERRHSIECGNKWDEKSFDVYRRNDDIYVKDIDGNPVRTSLVLNDFRICLERIIKQNPDISFINATEGGSNIEGAKNRKLKDVLIELKKAKITPMSYFIKNINKTQDIIKQLEYNLELMIEYINLCKNAKKLLSEYKMNYRLKKQNGVNKCIEQLNEIDKRIIEKNHEITLMTTLILKNNI